MSNEVNISQIASGTLDPGHGWEFYVPRPDYQAQIGKVAFFTAVPDASFDIVLEGYPEHRDIEITRTWNTVWSSLTAQGVAQGYIDHVFQRNVTVENLGPITTAFYVLVAETDN
ncbi:hypothetical protein BJN34_14355 [Cupriavidus necator]|uniref:Uncharacterized protein n=1 Tax=Cupriavidus necator TaxID=106590 RepID=A0A1U9UR07_CUPNE|nr:hypothetical protein [Cupriavidus necator]AQV95060.1 hypothetical protein BJN34_14355 [Cupriavidus necator]